MQEIILTYDQKNIQKFVRNHSLLLCIIGFVSMIISLIGGGKSALPSLIMVLALIVTLLINYYKRIQISRVLFLIIINVRILQILYDVGVGISIEYWFILCATLPAFLFSFKTEFKAIMISVSLISILWLYSFFNFKIGNLEIEAKNIIYTYIANITFLSIYSISILNSFGRNKIDNFKNFKKSEFSLKKASENKTNFLNTMSHEIRTPLNAIYGLSKIIETKNSNNKQIEDIEELNKNASTLLTLINDILDKSKEQSSKIGLVCKPNNLDIILEECLEKAKQNNTYAIKLNIQKKLPLVLIDRDKFKLLLSSLITEFTEKYKTTSILIHVNVVNTTKHNGLIMFKVDVEFNKKNIFFRKIVNYNSPEKNQNTKLKTELVTLFNTKILNKVYLHKFVNTFNISLKEVNLFPESYKNSCNEDLKLKGLRVLLVDDNKTNLMVAKFSLIKEGIVIETAENGLQAVEKMKVNTYNLVLMDLDMPVLDGLKATKEIRTFDTKTPIIAFTASIFDDIAEELMNHKFNGVINKPFQQKALVNYIKNIIGYE